MCNIEKGFSVLFFEQVAAKKERGGFSHITSFQLFVFHVEQIYSVLSLEK